MSELDALKNADKFYELREMPNAKTLMLKAAGTIIKKPTADTKAFKLGVRVQRVTIDREWIKAYNEVCGFNESNISLTAPQVLASPLHMYLMSCKDHPFPMMGMVHVHNSIELIKPLQFETPYDVIVVIGDTRIVRQGCHFDVHTKWLLEGETVWKSTMTLLSRVKGVPETIPKPIDPQPLGVTDAKYIALKVSENQGRKYAKVSNDYNPIHLCSITAKMFGFRQAIAHGMWTAAKTLSLLSVEMGKAPRQFDLSFRQPVFLPSLSSLKFVSNKNGADFELLSDKASKVQMSGSVKG
jgi:hypothetical protein